MVQESGPTDQGSRSAAVASIGARIDRLPSLTKWHYKFIALLIALFIFDLIDLSSFAYVAPALREQWKLSIEQIGLLTSIAFLGMFLGGIIGGRLADRFGRRRVLLSAVTFFSLASLASAFAPDAIFLGVTRFLTGFGLQAATGVILVLASEVFPKPFRGRVMAVVLGIGALIGGPGIALFAKVVVPMGLWHLVFVAGSLGIFIVLAGLKTLPESPRWLAGQGRYADPDVLVRVVEDEYLTSKGTALPEPFVDVFVPVVAKNSLWSIFSGGLIGRTIVATLMFCILVMLNYGLPQWLPVILVERGYPQSDALTFAFILSLSFGIGALAAVFIVDKIERKVTVTISALIMAVAYLSIGFIDNVAVLLFAGFIAGLLSQTVAATIYAYVPEMFPTEVRGMGAGFANGTGRIAGIFSGVIVAAVITAFATEGVFIYLAIVAFAMAVVIQFAPRTGVREARRALKAERHTATQAKSDDSVARNV